MNLIDDPWLPFDDGGHSPTLGRPCAIARSNVRGIRAARPDLGAGAWQLLIGLLQTAFAPDNEIEWRRRFLSPPSEGELREAFRVVRDAFALDGDGPLFMQGLEPGEGLEISLSKLFMDAPGQPDLNCDVFVPADRYESLDLATAALALYTLQANAPSGGKGMRVSLRAGGPATTLVLPSEADTLWRAVWLNVLPKDAFQTLPGDHTRPEIFPWLSPPRWSAEGLETTPLDVNPLQAFWGMPWRLRLEIEGSRAVGLRRLPYGLNYGGEWRHPLSPYYVDDDGAARALRPKEGGVGYRFWVGLVLGQSGKSIPARVVSHAVENRPEARRLWVSGYAMDNAEARAWVESLMPLYRVPGLEDFVRDLVEMSGEVANNLYQAVRKASPGGASEGASRVRDRFWHETEASFYSLLGHAATGDPDVVAWYRQITTHALQLFDHWAEGYDIGGASMRKMVEGRRALLGANARVREKLPMQGV